MTGTQTAPAAWHRRLMPDYNAPAAAYWWAAVAAGVWVLLWAGWQLGRLDAASLAQVLLGAALAAGAGLMPVRVPRAIHAFTAGEIFVFGLLLMHGTAAATVASAAEATVASWRSSRRWTSRIASPLIAALAMAVAGSSLELLRAQAQRAGLMNDGLLLLVAIVFALLYFCLNTLLVTAIGRLKRGDPLRWRPLITAYGWLGVAYVCNASVATLLVLSVQASGLVVVLAAVPIIVILLGTGHYHFRREEAEEAVRKAREQEAAQQVITQSARHAGMAEIASHVLHNVGNVLNSVNVSAERIGERVAASESAALARVVALMEAQAGALGTYLEQDARGRLVLPFLQQLAQALVAERETLLAEVATLRKHLEHIRHVVAAQQSYAGTGGHVEAADLGALVDDALRINTSGPSDPSVDIVRAGQWPPALMLDKHRVLLILVNLVRNARQALAGVPGQERWLEIRAGRSADGAMLCIDVTDNGVGIAAENLPRIFSHGFTTKPDGHGFGLHSCVLAARAMGGDLLVHSDGVGRGARFTLTLPWVPVSPATESR